MRFSIRTLLVLIALLLVSSRRMHSGTPVYDPPLDLPPLPDPFDLPNDPPSPFDEPSLFPDPFDDLPDPFDDLPPLPDFPPPEEAVPSAHLATPRATAAAGTATNVPAKLMPFPRPILFPVQLTVS